MAARASEAKRQAAQARRGQGVGAAAPGMLVPANPDPSALVAVAPDADKARLGMICERIAAGESLTSIATGEGVGYGALVMWLAGSPVRMAAYQEARAIASIAHDEKSELELDAAEDDFGLKKAQALATHRRWRVEHVGAQYYAKRHIVAGDPANPLTVQAMSDASLSVVARGAIIDVRPAVGQNEAPACEGGGDGEA